MAISLEQVRSTHASICNGLLGRNNVVAVGVGYKRVAGRATKDLAIICSVRAKRALQALSMHERIPASVQGVPIDVVQTGPLFAHQSRTTRVRPAPGGVSIGHYAITAGTLGCLVMKNGSLHILSNNHVLADSNEGKVGDAILQPGSVDGGRDPADRIAQLAEWVPIRFDGEPSGSGAVGDGVNRVGELVAELLESTAAVIRRRTQSQAMAPYPPVAATGNLVDCAIAKPLDASDVSPELLEIGRIAGLADGTLGMAIKKSGRTTGMTTGEIQQIDVAAQVDYGSGHTATFNDQLMAGAMSQGGDSGSAILDAQNHLVGLLFAGSNSTTIINRIQNVFSALDLSLP